ncbi:hypothetical protein F4802DRAFT_298734 [Xylaria palmicola]|nr:hypothetical protein F4802DRAFT_298734 [Xylaria palmicola]
MVSGNQWCLKGCVSCLRWVLTQVIVAGSAPPSLWVGCHCDDYISGGQGGCTALLPSPTRPPSSHHVELLTAGQGGNPSSRLHPILSAFDSRIPRHVASTPI